MAQIRYVLFLLVLIQTSHTFGQTIDAQVDKIKSIKHHIQQHKNNPAEYNKTEIDGVIPAQITRKKVLGVFNTTISQRFGGYFSKSKLMKDAVLVSIQRWERIFLNSQEDSSKMSYQMLIYDENRLCYYYEIKKYERANNKDSLIYQIELFLNKNGIIRKNIAGSIEAGDAFLRDRIIYSEELYNRN